MQIIFACSFFHQAYCFFSRAFPQTKKEICKELPPIFKKNLNAPIMWNLVEFCESDSVGHFSNNYLCQDLKYFTSLPYVSSAVANDLTEFCSPETPILSRE